ncbi:MAG TPA: leucine-rich repeat protein [Lachnospiraceae bacterium]|nr:leucine-rich repeat protein [Lachnospiraceae bacterium]
MKHAKHLIYLLAALIITVIVSMTGKQQVYAENSGFWSYYVQSGEAYITAYSGAESNVTIPSKIDGKKVVGIMNGAFYNNSFLTNITIPSTVKFIGKETINDHGVFENCTNLVNVKGMKNVTVIGDKVFKDCIKITSFNFTGITSIGDYSFMNTGFEKLSLPKMSMGDFAFSNTPITSLTMTTGSHVGARAFSDCDKLTSVVLPNALVYVSDSPNVINDHVGVFESCDSLKSANIKGNIIPKNCFLDCISLSSVEVTSNLKIVGDMAFSGCKGLTTISFPYGLTAIEDRAFYGCGSLQSISLPNSLTSMGDYVFTNYNNSEGIFVPSSVTYIGNYCFGFNSKISISCYKDSAAYTYAVNHKINYTEKNQISSTSLTLSSTKVSLEAGDSKQITVTYAPSNTTDCVFWKSNNPSIATVDGAGVITGVSGGTVAIIATTPSGLAKSITVYVNNITTIKWSKEYKDSNYWSIKPGKTFTNVAKPYGYYNGNQKNRTGLKVTYKSSDTSVATVDKKGKVTAKKDGIAKIIATITTSGYEYTGWYNIEVDN